jgi:GntR family transcriptional regulator
MEQPLYLHISGQLRQSILTGEYKPEDMLPSEHELATAYKTSRVTVRKSLDVLESEGLIKSWHGKGYFVQPPKHTLFTLYFGDMTGDGRFRFQEVNIIRPEKDVAETLQLKKHQMAIVTRRLLERGGKPVAYDEKFIPYERGVPCIEFEIHFTEFPSMFEGRFSPLSLRTEMSIGMEAVPGHICAALGVSADTRLLVVSRLIRASDEQPVGFGKQYLTESYGKLTAKSGYYTTEKL